jgi:transposase
MKHTEQFKLAVVQHYLDGPAGFRKVAQHYDVSAPIVRAWVARYRLHGAEGLSQRKRGHYTGEFKLSVLKHMWDNGLSFRQTAAVFNLPNSGRIGEWERLYQSGGADSLGRRPRTNNGKMKPPTTNPTPTPPGGEDKRTREELLKELAYLRMENDYLKKLKALVDAKSAAAKKRK